ncbi:MAG: hypothetical protein OXH69_01330 [Acidobacteria bacterium]|nr:hypothetical protein [Acidobacteriota bacterium]
MTVRRGRPQSHPIQSRRRGDAATRLHLWVLSYQGMPFVAAALIRFLRSPSPAWTAALTVAFLARRS